MEGEEEMKPCFWDMLTDENKKKWKEAQMIKKLERQKGLEEYG